MNATGFVPLTVAQCDAIDYLHNARWLPVQALHPRTLTGLCDAGLASVADGYIQLTTTGWDLYEVQGEVGA